MKNRVKISDREYNIAWMIVAVCQLFYAVFSPSVLNVMKLPQNLLSQTIIISIFGLFCFLGFSAAFGKEKTNELMRSKVTLAFMIINVVVSITVLYFTGRLVGGN